MWREQKTCYSMLFQLSGLQGRLRHYRVALSVCFAVAQVKSVHKMDECTFHAALDELDAKWSREGFAVTPDDGFC